MRTSPLPGLLLVVSFTPLLHLPSPWSFPILPRRFSPTPRPISSAGVAPTLFPVHLASSHRAVSFWPTRLVSLRSIYYTSFPLPFPVRWFVFLVYPSPHDQIKRRRNRKSRWWKDLGLVCHHRLTADEGEWETERGNRSGTVERTGFIGLVSKKNQDSLLLATRPVLYEKAN